MQERFKYWVFKKKNNWLKKKIKHSASQLLPLQGSCVENCRELEQQKECIVFEMTITPKENYTAQKNSSFTVLLEDSCFAKDEKQENKDLNWHRFTTPFAPVTIHFM